MLKPELDDLTTLKQFLRQATPDEWLSEAMNQLPLLLLDHAHCERKAAATALVFINKYPHETKLITLMSALAREELLHFEKVISLLHQKKIKYTPLPPSLYAQKLHENITKNNDLSQLCDQLIIGAIIEARSCERFSLLATHLEDRIVARFYASLIKSEARHFKEYLHLASSYGGDIHERVLFFLDIENKLIRQEELIFRIHSGKPILNNHLN